MVLNHIEELPLEREKRSNSVIFMNSIMPSKHDDGLRAMTYCSELHAHPLPRGLA